MGKEQETIDTIRDSQYIYQRLYNDISITEPELCLYNQEGEINKQNTLKKPPIRPFRDFIDGGVVIKRNKNYSCRYTYDLKSDGHLLNNRRLEFITYDGKSGSNFMDFVDSVLKADPNIFTKVEDFVLYDVRNRLFDVAYIVVNDTIIDDAFLKIIKKYFHRLGKIVFDKCYIKSECNFDGIKTHINIVSSVIENIRSFNDCEADIDIGRSKVLNITPSNIKSSNVSISDDLGKRGNIKELFLKCNFPNLVSLHISSDPEYSYEDSLTYLPDSAPNLENITILGRVKDLNFLTKFKYLLDISILSEEDEHSLFLPSITSANERKKLYERNKKQLEINKILYPNEDERTLLADIEENRIKRLCHFLSRLSYTEADKIFTNDVIKTIYEKPVDPLIPYYYECWYDTLKPKKQLESKDGFYRDDNVYRFYNNFLCEFRTNIIHRINKKQIVKAVPFLYATNGLPIIHKTDYKPVNSIEDAKKLVEKGYYDCAPSHDYEYDLFIDLLKSYASSERKTIRANDFFGKIRSSAHYFVTGDTFKSFGPAGMKISYIYDTFCRGRDRNEAIDDKILEYHKLYNALLMNYYDSFTLEEKMYIYDKGSGINIYRYHNGPEYQDNYDEEKTLKSIDEKTNGLYSKYYNYIKCFQALKEIKPYDDIDIPTSDIKKLVLH